MSDPQSIDLEFVRLNEENQVLRQSLLEAQGERDRLKVACEESENYVDEQWLDAIAHHWKNLTGKFWETLDGEVAEEGRKANVSALFQYIEDQRDAGQDLLDRFNALKAELTRWQLAFGAFPGTPEELAKAAVEDRQKLNRYDFLFKDVGELIEIVEGVKCKEWVERETHYRLKDTEAWCALYVMFHKISLEALKGQP